MTSPSSSLPPIERGTRLTDFGSLDLEVEDSAEGGYGLVVWGPNHASGGQMTALKLPRPDLLARANAISEAEGERLRHEFEREALTWCHLWAHADIVNADFLTRLPGWDNLPALVLEYAPGGSLRQTLRKAHSSRTAHLPLRSALAWGQQVAAALAVIHQPDPAYERPEPLIHCDLKPENVLLNARGWAKLTDLGLTRAYAVTASETTGGSDINDVPGVQGATQASELPTGETRAARLAQMRAALQAAGLLTVSPDDPTAAGALPLKQGAAADQRQATRASSVAPPSRLQTRSMRMPPISAAMLTTLLATPPGSGASSADLARPASGPASAAPTTIETALAEDPGIGSRGPALGTPPYMPPEQWWGLDAVTPATDVYALGVLLFELFAGGAWSPQQQRWLDDDADMAATMPATAERYVRFPHAPQFSAEARLYAEGGWGGGQQAYCAAWYAAHRAGPTWRLADPAVGALTRGPLAEVAAGETHNAQQARQALTALSDLIAACLAPKEAQRPTAEEAQRRLGEIAQMVGEEPLTIPEALPHNPESEAVFWGNLAVTYSYIRQYEERLRLQRRVVALSPEEPLYWMNLGVAFLEVDRFEEALAALAEAERWLTPGYQAREPQRAARLARSIPNNQSNALSRLGRYAEAVAVYRRVLAQRPDMVVTRFNLALALAHWSAAPKTTREQQLERLLAARSEIQRVLAESPAMSQGPELLGQIERALTQIGQQ